MAAGTYQAINPHSQSIYDRGTVSLDEKASATWKKGTPLILTSGVADVVGTAPAVVEYIAAENAHNGASDGLYKIAAWPVVAGDLWEISFEDSLAIADYGGVYGIKIDATSTHWIVDDGDTGDQVYVVRPVITPSLGNVGDTKWRGIVSFQTANTLLA